MKIVSIEVVFFDLGNTLVKTGLAERAEWIEGAKEAIFKLNNEKIRLGIISNTGNINREHLLKKILPLDFPIELFDSNLIVLSSEIGITKPDPGIFLYAIDKSGVSPANCLLSSEELTDIFIAQHVGMYSVWLPLSSSYSIKELAEFLSKQVNSK